MFWKRIKTLEKKVRELESLVIIVKRLERLRWCSECSSPYMVRLDTSLPYFHGSTLSEITNCESCDEIVEKRSKAVELAKACPDKVLKIKTCKGELK